MNISDLSLITSSTENVVNSSNFTTPVKDLDFSTLFNDRQKPDVSRTYELTNQKVSNPKQTIIGTNNLKVIASSKDLSKMEIDDEDLAKVQDSIVSLIANQLGISKQDVKSQLQKMNMTAFDLLDSSKLAQFVGTTTNIGNQLNLLTNNTMQTLLEGVDEIKHQMMGMLNVDKEQLDRILANNSEIFSEILEQVHFSSKKGDNVMPAVVEEIKQENLTKESQSVVAEDPKTEPNEQQLAQTVVSNQVSKEPIEVASTAVKAVEGDTSTKVVHLTANQENQMIEEFQSVANNSDGGESQFDPNNEAGNERFMNFLGQDQSLASLVTDGGLGVDKQITIPFDMQQIINELTDFTKLSIGKEISTMEMQLTPENLGKVFVQVSTHAEHVVAQIAVEDQTAKEIIQSQMGQLRDNLTNAGVKISAIEVTIASHEFERNLNGREQQENQPKEQENRTKRRQIDLSNLDLDQLTGTLSEEDQIVARMMSEQGNQLDYQA